MRQFLIDGMERPACKKCLTAMKLAPTVEYGPRDGRAEPNRDNRVEENRQRAFKHGRTGYDQPKWVAKSAAVWAAQKEMLWLLEQVGAAQKYQYLLPDSG